jgi:hypothetical protein
MMKRTLVFATLACAAFSGAQVTPLTIHAGYHRTNTFTAANGNRTHLEGIELGVSQSYVRLPFLGEIRLGASVVFGGALRRGGDADGNIFAVQASYRTPSAGPNGLYGLTGFGYYSAQARGRSFDNVSGLGVHFGVGLPLSSPVPGVPAPAIELQYRLGPKEQLRGLSLGLALRF